MTTSPLTLSFKVARENWPDGLRQCTFIITFGGVQLHERNDESFQVIRNYIRHSEDSDLLSALLEALLFDDRAWIAGRDYLKVDVSDANEQAEAAIIDEIKRLTFTAVRDVSVYNPVTVIN